MATDEGTLARINALYMFLHEHANDMSNFEQRLMLQKTGYLLRSVGISITPLQSWYMRGPYSSMLTAMGYEIKEHASLPALSVPESMQQTLTELKETFGPELHDPDKIELLVSVIYVLKEVRESDTEKVCQWIKERKPWYADSEILQMIEKVRVNHTLFGM